MKPLLRALRPVMNRGIPFKLAALLSGAGLLLVLPLFLLIFFPEAGLSADMRRLGWIVALLASGGVIVLLLAGVSECRRLMEETAAKQRIESELDVAREIRMSSLPRVFPPPGVALVSMHAVLEPAGEAGGGLYDCYALDGGRMGVAVGGVSGKGVPAAVFLEKTKTLLKAFAGVAGTPNGVFARTNAALVEGNGKRLSATAFFGVLHVGTGELDYSRAGHPPALLLRRSGALEFLDAGKGPPLGVRPEAVFGRARALLQNGDRVFLYGDGVAGAVDPAGALFGEERLIGSLRRAWDKPPGELIAAVKEDIGAFSGDGRSGDIAMMVFGLVEKS